MDEIHALAVSTGMYVQSDNDPGIMFSVHFWQFIWKHRDLIERLVRKAERELPPEAVCPLSRIATCTWIYKKKLMITEEETRELICVFHALLEYLRVDHTINGMMPIMEERRRMDERRRRIEEQRRARLRMKYEGS